LQISLALTPPILLSASWLTNKQNYPSNVILTVALSSSLLMVLFCSFEDEYAHYKMLFHHGVLGLIMSASLAFFIVCAKQSLAKVCIMIVVVLKNRDFIGRCKSRTGTTQTASPGRINSDRLGSTRIVTDHEKKN